MANYLVVLFKNNKRKKIINEFITFERAKSFFNNYVKKHNDIIFNKEFISGVESKFEVGLVQIGKSPENSIYLKDNFGRNIKIKFDEKNMSLLMIEPIKVEELIYDFQKKEKISFTKIVEVYLKGSGMKMISGLNNKVIIQEENNINIFILKNTKECERFLDIISEFFFKKRRIDCIVVKDSSMAQRKYLYDLLVSKGFDKQFLYRKSTFAVPLK
jgi:hypothetical protein